MRLQLVHLWEPSARDGVEDLEWFPLTSLEEVASQADAEQVLQWYRLRWRIEDSHRILKSGCKVWSTSGTARKSGDDQGSDCLAAGCADAVMSRDPGIAG